jgi:hypothetical protein
MLVLRLADKKMPSINVPPKISPPKDPRLEKDIVGLGVSDRREKPAARHERGLVTDSTTQRGTPNREMILMNPCLPTAKKWGR